MKGIIFLVILNLGKSPSKQEISMRVKNIRLVRKIIARESQEFQNFLEPFLIEMCRIYLIESKRIFHEKRDFFFVKDSQELRRHSMFSLPVWASVFEFQGVSQLDNLEFIIKNIHRLNPNNFINLIYLRHFYNYLFLLYKTEHDPSLVSKFNSKFLMEDNKFPHKSTKKQLSQSRLFQLSNK
jgi:hypothetical protein